MRRALYKGEECYVHFSGYHGGVLCIETISGSKMWGGFILSDIKYIDPPPQPKPKPIPFEWEELDKTMRRAKVFGGWVLHNSFYYGGNSFSESMAFMPDPNHEWEIEKPTSGATP